MRTVLHTLTLLTVVTTVGVGQMVPPRGSSPARDRQPEDTVEVPHFRVEPPVAPLGAMWRSLLVPGWGQAALHRRGTGAFFVFMEGLTMAMTLKSLHQLGFEEQTDAETVEAKRDEVQDWAVLWGFNHLLAALEAFVAAELWDFPAELEAQPLPDGGIGLGLSVYWR